MEFYHVPVMAEACMQALSPRENGIYVDCTLGGAGHSSLLLSQYPIGKLIAIDKDRDALEASQKRLSPWKDKVTFVKSDFKCVSDVLEHTGVERVDGVLMDLGVSSYQLDNYERGFSYRATDAPLDMRQDAEQALSAFDVVNGYGERDLIRILRDYGEERFAPRIARNILRKREQQVIRTCGELVDIIYASIPAAARRTGGHPAKRTFQAIRIEVNGELLYLKQAINEWIEALNPGGRIAVITFHSLEDRIVKTAFKELENPCTCDPRAPICTCGKVPTVKIITKKPIEANEQELEENPRSQSAKLRIAEKL